MCFSLDETFMSRNKHNAFLNRQIWKTFGREGERVRNLWKEETFKGRRGKCVFLDWRKREPMRDGAVGTDGEKKEQWQEVIFRWVWLFNKMCPLGGKMGFLELHIYRSHSEPSFRLIHVPGDVLLSHRWTNLSKQWSSKTLCCCFWEKNVQE